MARRDCIRYKDGRCCVCNPALVGSRFPKVRNIYWDGYEENERKLWKEMLEQLDLKNLKLETEKPLVEIEDRDFDDEDSDDGRSSQCDVEDSELDCEDTGLRVLGH